MKGDNPEEDRELFNKIGEFIKSSRVQRDLTQEQAGLLIGVDKMHFSKMEKGQKMSIPTLTKLMRAFKFDIEFVPKQE